MNSAMPNRFADCHRLKKGGKKDYSKDTKAVVEKKKENIDVSFNNYFRFPFFFDFDLEIRVIVDTFPHHLLLSKFDWNCKVLFTRKLPHLHLWNSDI